VYGPTEFTPGPLDVMYRSEKFLPSTFRGPASLAFPRHRLLSRGFPLTALGPEKRFTPRASWQPPFAVAPAPATIEPPFPAST